MNSSNNSLLTQQVEQYMRWRREIFRQLSRYRTWLEDCKLDSDEALAQLDEAFDVLQKDQIRLAFVGEFSRGKTELINALFFAHYGMKVLPSGGGRTTMCPTELYFDGQSKTSHIRLLPIETRMGGSSLTSFKKIPDHWVYVPLNPDDPETLRKAFSEVAAMKAVRQEDAAAMGFQVNILERHEDDDNKVYVPAWRHAMISFDHPLLRQGLIIMDTPGLNALGCEPELTFSLLPEAHAICFLLSASTGVSGTDLDIWNRHIRDLSLQETTGVFAILNKIDSLWDELESPAYNREMIRQMQNQCARLLSIAPDEIVPVSAKEALVAKADKDTDRLAQSNLPALEKLLSVDITRRKELILKNKVVKDALTMLHGSRKMLQRRRENLLDQIEILSSSAENRKQKLQELENQTKTEQAFYHKKLIALKTSRKVMEREGKEMLSHLDPANIEKYRQEAGKALTQSWTIVGMNNAIDVFFTRLQTNIEDFSARQAEIQKTVADIYAEYEVEQGLAPIDYARLDVKPYLVRLNDLRNKSGSFRRNLKKLLTEQKSTSKRFFLTIANEGANIYLELLKNAKQWLNNVLLPIYQNTQKTKQLLDEQVYRFKALANETQSVEKKASDLDDLVNEIDIQIEQADDIIHELRQPAPSEIQRKAPQFATSGVS
ncbi:MAG: dynamin family protein [Ketobacteraceae bacterium]|nr:dynamin family protein [Ketobacteraceae bacterium]